MMGRRKRSTSASTSSPDPLLAEGEERVLGHGEEAPLRHVPPRHLRGRETHVASEGDEVPGLAQWHLPPDVVHHVLDVPAQEAHALLVAPVPGGEVLAHADGAEGVGAGVDGLALAEERDVRAPPAHLHEERVPRGESLVVAQHLAHGHVGEPVLLGAVDDLDVDPGAQPHPVQEGVAVQGLAHRAGGDRAVADHPVGVHDPPEPFQGLERDLDGGGPQATVGEGVLAEEHAAGCLLEQAGSLAHLRFRDHQADRARPHVQDRDRPLHLGRRRREVGPRQRTALSRRHPLRPGPRAVARDGRPREAGRR